MGGSTGTARRRTWVWVTVDDDSYQGIGIWDTDTEPTPNDEGGWESGGSGWSYVPKHLTGVFGLDILSIRPGTCQKVQFSAKVVK